MGVVLNVPRQQFPHRREKGSKIGIPAPRQGDVSIKLNLHLSAMGVMMQKGKKQDLTPTVLNVSAPNI
jgi:hypothetical protein